MSAPLITGYKLKLAPPECSPGASWYIANAELQDDMRKVLPYLNAELGGLDYYHDSGILLWSDGGKRYAFRPHEIAVTPIESNEEAERVVSRIIHTVNDIWDRRHEIVPDFSGKKSPPKVLDVYRLLPRTNCRECGSATCMAFAAALRNDASKWSLCPYLSGQDYLALL